MFELEVVGGGRMGEALVTGMLDGGLVQADQLVIIEISDVRRRELVSKFSGVQITDTPVAARSVILATKPGDAVDAMKAIVSAGAERVLSIAAGVPLQVLEASTPTDVSIIRAMPNTPALVGQGAAAIAAGPSVPEDDLAWAEMIFRTVGSVVRLPESQLDAVTGLSGSGPAYVFLLAEAMIEAGVLQGLPRQVSTDLALQTIKGAAELMTRGDAGPEELRAAVTSPGGTTAAGLLEFERGAFRAMVVDAVAAASDRAREMRSVELARSPGVTSAAEDSDSH